jgi:hypothetical protein
MVQPTLPVVPARAADLSGEWAPDRIAGPDCDEAAAAAVRGEPDFAGSLRTCRAGKPASISERDRVLRPYHGLVRADDMAFVSGFLVATGFFWILFGGLWLVFCLRRLSRIRIRLVGVPTRGEVIGMVVRSDAKGTVLNSPQVRYFSPQGPSVVTKAVGYRSRQMVVTGAQVRLWYDPLRPERILVSRFDICPRDFLALTVSSVFTGIGVALEVAAYLIA